MLKPWQPISHETILSEPWFKMQRHTVLKGNGQPMHNYYVWQFSHWVSVLPVTAEGQIVLVRQYRYAYGQFSIELPGGIMDAHETNPELAAHRELKEETGYTSPNLTLVATLAPNPATQNNTFYCFVATNCQLTHAQNFDANEEIETMLVSPAELLHMLRNNQILQSLHTSSIMYGLMHLGLL
ncbi:MAG: NUDIX hydrolase [Bacteroidetes bacterium]|nr:MAG: NUDIX hydrolase [Bacteroidota bacterium]